MADEITVDRQTLRALGAQSRISILKSLAGHRLAQSQIAQGLGMSEPSVSEHLRQLKAAGLIVQADSGGRKWKYYEITQKGIAIVRPTNTRVLFLLGLSILVFAAAAFSAYNGLGGQIGIPQSVQNSIAPAAAPMAGQGAYVAAVQASGSAAARGASAVQAISPTLWLILFASLFATGLCAGHLLKRE